MTMFHIAGQTVSGSSTSTITFNSIPQQYAHIEIRSYIPSSTSNSGGVGNIWWYPNGAALSNGTIHELSTNVAGTSSGAVTGLPWVRTGYQNASSSFPIVSISTLLDYSNTNKFKTTRYMGGSDTNATTNPYVSFGSGLIQTLSAITSMTFGIDNGVFVAGSRIDLYGISSSSVTGA
jgi:hypothetical protein